MSDSLAKGHSFMKIILSDVSSCNNLMIPEKFVRRYINHLHVRVYLKAPRGAVWPIDLVKDGTKVWLQNGWPEFARFYSICFGHFLIFKYQENSCFDVHIYDKSATEIDYPIVDSTAQDNLSSGQLTQLGKRVKTENIDQPRTCKKTRANSACTEAIHVGGCLMRKSQLTKSSNVNKEEGSIMVDEGKARALALAIAFKSDHPYFMLTVFPSHISKKGAVNIKRAFAERYLSEKSSADVCLQVEGRTWSVRYKNHSHRCRFYQGWAQFRHDNSLSVGDICIFELVDRTSLLLKVFIYRAGKC